MGRWPCPANPAHNLKSVAIPDNDGDWRILLAYAYCEACEKVFKQQLVETFEKVTRQKWTFGNEIVQGGV